jgi:hypothetical protein
VLFKRFISIPFSPTAVSISSTLCSSYCEDARNTAEANHSDDRGLNYSWLEKNEVDGRYYALRFYVSKKKIVNNFVHKHTS